MVLNTRFKEKLGISTGFWELMRSSRIPHPVKWNIKRDLTNLLPLAICLSELALLSCDPEFSVATITAEEFRFTPNQVKLPARQKVRLIVRNQGREGHVFQSPILALKNIRVDGKFLARSEEGGDRIQIKPGERIELQLVLPEGLYPFRCLMKGHRGMEGTLVLEK